ncbi:chemokine (C-C motif) ligand 34a, duplicate 3 [Pseudorasbora parva]|uniref:chemokine (C-C motif) ligand 34a, duplicate 3 n=1 Tax=Pseudorasbora parva TaxID=51549 RepID=UPI00351DB6C4
MLTEVSSLHPEDLSRERNMQLNQKMTMTLAAIALISIMIMETNGQNIPTECCTSASTKEITLPITGFKLQIKNLPCVKAVIFFTSEGPICSHWSEKWVREKLQELRKVQGLQNTNSTASTPLSTSSP